MPDAGAAAFGAAPSFRAAMRAFLAAAIFSSRESFSAMSRSVFCFFRASDASSRSLALAILI